MDTLYVGEGAPSSPRSPMANARQRGLPLPGFRTQIRYLLHLDTRGAEFFFLLITGGWGIWVACHGNATFTGNSAFRIMAEIAPQPVWAAAAIVVAALRFYGLTLDLWLLRVVAAIFGFFIWTLTACSIGQADPNSTGVVVYGGYALINLHIVNSILRGRVELWRGRASAQR